MSKSILEEIAQNVFKAKTLEQGRSIILQHLDNAPVQDKDIKKMRTAVVYQIFTKTKLDSYTSNEILTHSVK